MDLIPVISLEELEAQITELAGHLNGANYRWRAGEASAWTMSSAYGCFAIRPIVGAATIRAIVTFPGNV